MPGSAAWQPLRAQTCAHALSYSRKNIWNLTGGGYTFTDDSAFVIKAVSNRSSSAVQEYCVLQLSQVENF